MGLLKIKSENEKLGYLINKNPNTGMNIENFKNGTLYGWYKGLNEYVLYFVDGEVSSFSKEEYNYNDTTRFSSASMYLNMLTTVKGAKKGSSDDEPTNTSIEITALNIPNKRMLEIFEKNFPLVTVTKNKLTETTYHLIFTAESTLEKLVKTIELFLLYISGTAREKYIDDSLLKKYLTIMVELDVDYHFRTIIKNNFIKSREQFNKFESYFNESDKFNLRLEHGNTHDQRYNFITKNLGFSRNILDIGAGEGVHAVPYSSKLNKENKEYFAVDIDSKALRELQYKKSVRKLDNLNIYDDVKKAVADLKVETDVILTEVIEHMSKEEAKELISYVLENVNVQRFVITTPNVSFNKYYHMEEGAIRHTDHKFEPTLEEFKDLITEVVETHPSYRIKGFGGIGDVVNTEQTSSYAIIENISLKNTEINDKIVDKKIDVIKKEQKAVNNSVLRFKEHSLILLVGITQCGKTTFSKEVLLPQLEKSNPELNYKRRVAYISSDDIRADLIGDSELDRYDSNMMESSEASFKLLNAKVDISMNYPINSEFVIVDTTGLNEEFRKEMKELADKNNYHTYVVTFDYSYKEYFNKNTLGRKKIDYLVTHYKKDVLPKLSKKYCEDIFRIKQKDFSKISIKVTDEEEYMNNLVSGNLEIVGDVHEQVDKLKESISEISTDDATIIIAGDWIDKGNNPKETIKYLYENKDTFKLILGNHENYIYKKLKKVTMGILDNEEELFSSLKLIENLSEDYKNMFFELVENSHPYIKRIGKGEERTVFITHAPTETKYIGKLDKKSLKKQRTNRLRGKELTEELAYLEKYPKNYPFYVFGHVSFQKPLMLGSVFGIDTGAVTNGMLTRLSIFKNRAKIHTIGEANGELPIIFKKKVNEVNLDKLNDRNKKRLKSAIKNKLMYISGTMSPSNSDKETGDIESLESALNYFKSKEIRYLIGEPKYMGSRCTIVLDKNSKKSYATSRNGFKINRIDLSKVYETLLTRYETYMELNKIKKIILDGELLPWNALGKSLIDSGFNGISNPMKKELSILKETDFENVLQEKLSSLDREQYNKDKNILNKQEIIKKYGGKDARIYKSLENIQLNTLEDMENGIKVFEQQLDYYAQDMPTEYKAFNILKIIYEDGTEKKFSEDMEEVYEFVNDDDYVVIDLESENALEVAQEYFNKITLDKHMEGIVLKPKTYKKGVAPYMKVRNKDYLTLVYGWNYLEKEKNKELVAKKNISKKLKISIAEYEFGEQLLAIPESELGEDNKEYVQLLANLMFEQEKEEYLDPRL